MNGPSGIGSRPCNAGWKARNSVQNQTKPKPAQIRFWFQELRTPELLVELAVRYPAICRRFAKERPLLAHAQSGKIAELEKALLAEETAERQRDREYWLPLRQELEKLRHMAVTDRLPLQRIPAASATIYLIAGCNGAQSYYAVRGFRGSLRV